MHHPWVTGVIADDGASLTNLGQEVYHASRCSAKVGSSRLCGTEM